MHRPDASPPALFRSLRRHADLICRMAGREVSQRFRGSMLGATWAVLTPLLTAAVFTLVFTGVFPTRWPRGGGSAFDFALILLTGLAVYNLFAEVVLRAPALVSSNPSYVTKVVFPLEVLPAVTILSALANCTITFGLVLLGHAVTHGGPHPTALLLPVVLLPFVVMLLGAALLLASAGVFIRDINQTIGPVVSLMMFLSPIFYPLESVPPAWQFLVRLNPLTSIIEQSRTVLVFGGWPDFVSLGLYGLLALALLAFAFWTFQRLRPGFADVL